MNAPSNTPRTAESQLARIRAGEDSTPPTPGVWMTPEQLWHALLEMHPSTRLDRLQTLIASAQKAEQCFLQNHEDRIAFLELREVPCAREV